MGISDSIQEGKGIIIAVIGAVIVLVIAGVVFGFLNSSSNQLTDVFSKAENMKYQTYNGTILEGELVKNVLKDTPFTCMVYTKKNADGTSYGPATDASAPSETPSTFEYVEELGMLRATGVSVSPDIRHDNVSKIENKTSAQFVNPQAPFYSMIVIDDNDTLFGVVFQQVGATGPIDPDYLTD